MTSEEKILKVLQAIKSKSDISPINAEISYYAGQESTGLSSEDEIMILNKIEEEGVISVISNYASEYI